jgi:hypothetical protein
MDRVMAVAIRGSRRGQPGVAALGAFVAIVRWLRRRSQGDQLLFKKVLAEGETLQITFLRNDTVVDRTAIEG